MPTIRASSELRNNYPEISGICKNGEPVFLTVNGKGDTVLMSIADYDRFFAENFLKQQLREAADDIANGRTIPAAQVFAELRAENEMLLAKAGLKQ